MARNRGLHRLLVDGVTVEYRTAEGGIRGAQARVLDFEDADADESATIWTTFQQLQTYKADTRRAASPAASRATGASVSSGTRRARARA